MRSFWLHLKAAWNYGRTFPYIEAVDADDFWSEADSTALNVFLNSYTGKKFKLRLRNFTIQTAVAEALDVNSARGKASGAMALVGYIEAHIPQQQETAETTKKVEFETVEA